MVWWIASLVLLVIGVEVYWIRRYRSLQHLLDREKEALERAAAERREFLEQELAKRQALFDRMVEGVLLLDPDGRIEFLNLAARRLLRGTGNLQGKTLDEAFGRPELTKLTARAFTEGQVLGEELEFEEITPRYLRVNASTFQGARSSRPAVLLVFHDVTRLKQLEATRQEFVANVSHELRTPLSLIKGFAETLLHSEETDAAVLKKFLQSINKHADRLTFLIEDLLALSKLESGRVAIHLQPIVLQELIEEVMGDLRSRGDEKKMILENLAPPLLMALGDKERLEQVFFNLVENAIKYGKPGGKVLVQARPLAGSRVEICVVDDGPGIPLEARDRVFERFYRVDRARSRESGGTGLGLSIVKHIVQAHGGEVWLQSAPGAGAAFYFTLPGVPSEDARFD